MNPEDVLQSPWADIPSQPVAPPPPMLTPDMLYPSFPNPAGLGLQIPYPDEQPPVIPPPAMLPALPIGNPDQELGPWALLQMMGGDGL